MRTAKVQNGRAHIGDLVEFTQADGRRIEGIVQRIFHGGRRGSILTLAITSERRRGEQAQRNIEASCVARLLKALPPGHQRSCTVADGKRVHVGEWVYYPALQRRGQVLEIVRHGDRGMLLTVRWHPNAETGSVYARLVWKVIL